MIKKKNMIQSLALSALMTSINAIIILISSISSAFFISDIILILFLPFITSFAFLFIDKKMAFCYVIASLVICLVINLEKTLFYLIPSLISGYLFATLIEKKVNIVWIITFTSIVNSLVSFGLFYVVKFIFSTSIYDAFRLLFGIDEDKASTIFPLFIVVTSSIQTILNALIIIPELKKFDVFIKMDDSPNKILLITSITTSSIGCISMFFVPDFAYLCLGISLLCSIPTYIYIIKQKRYITLGIVVFASIFGFAILSTFLPEYGALPFCFINLIIAVLGLYLYKYAHRFN